MVNPVEKNIPDDVERQEGQGEERQVDGPARQHGLRRPRRRRRPDLRRHQQRQAARPEHQGRQGRGDVLPRGRRQVPLADRPRQARRSATWTPATTGSPRRPRVEGDRLYYVSNRCELVCADVAGDRQEGQGQDRLDARHDQGPEGLPLRHRGRSRQLLAAGRRRSRLRRHRNGVDGNTEKLPEPRRPELRRRQQEDGKVAWSSNLPGTNIMDGQWGNPAAAEVNGVEASDLPRRRRLAVRLRGEDGQAALEVRLQPQEGRIQAGRARAIATIIVATPVVDDNKLLHRRRPGAGRRPRRRPSVVHRHHQEAEEQGQGPVAGQRQFRSQSGGQQGLRPRLALSAACSSRSRSERPTAITSSAARSAPWPSTTAWSTPPSWTASCTASTPQTGKKIWEHDLGGATWSSPYYVDGKVYMGMDNGDLYVFKAGKSRQGARRRSRWASR